MAKIKVTSRPVSFRRAGIAFTREPREIEVSSKVLKILAAEPNLQVQVLPEPKAGKKKD